MRTFAIGGVIITFPIAAVAVFGSNDSQALWIVAGIFGGVSVATIGWETSLTIAGVKNEQCADDAGGD